jgi:pimeloyl-ACP methyl ester carboxylesterase
MAAAHGMTELIDAGTGPDGIICLHGWCCRPGDFADQIDAVSAHHRILVPDWQHRMVRRDAGYSFRDICEDIVQLAQERGMQRPLLCGHSMGGFLAAYLAKERMLDHRGLLVLDSSLPLPDGIRQRYLKLADDLEAGPYDEIYRAFGESAFFVDAELGYRSNAILKGMLAQPPEVAIGLLREICSLDFAASLSAIDRPMHLIASGKGAMDLEALGGLVSSLTGEQWSTAGHFITIFRPDDVTSVMERVLAESG